VVIKKSCLAGGRSERPSIRPHTAKSICEGQDLPSGPTEVPCPAPQNNKIQRGRISSFVFPRGPIYAVVVLSYAVQAVGLLFSDVYLHVFGLITCKGAAGFRYGANTVWRSRIFFEAQVAVV